ncbi:anti-sigma factor [Sphingomonas profundi]|uniref:anti-sigma factor n=1 Tax=Alterirhizorhabdus profundi TaxID=2681549 RepID=UPI0012E82A0B|nr:anti-sigma factor [Sphingomonas profundi]
MSEELEAAAGEYVLGTLDAAERAAFDRRLSGDAAARRAVAAWRGRLEPLLTTAPEIAPPPHLWAAIERRVAPAAANDNRVSPLWRGLAIAASLLAVVTGTLALRPPLPASPIPAPVVLASTPAAGPAYVAAVTAKGAEPALLVTIDAATGKAIVRAIGLTPPARKSLELWYIGEGRDPQSLGTIAGDARMEMPLGPMMARGDRLNASTFAITAEPEGGAPAGRPTGAVMYSGKPMALTGA